MTGDRGFVDVEITDESMQELAETAKEVFAGIHGDMAEMRDLIDGF